MEKHININKIVPICLALCLLVLCALFSGCTPGGSEVTTSPDKETSPETTLGISPKQLQRKPMRIRQMLPTRL